MTRRDPTSDATAAFLQFLANGEFSSPGAVLPDNDASGTDRPTDSRSGHCRRGRFRHDAQPGIPVPAILPTPESKPKRTARQSAAPANSDFTPACAGTKRKKIRRPRADRSKLHVARPFGFCGSHACRGGRPARGAGHAGGERPRVPARSVARAGGGDPAWTPWVRAPVRAATWRAPGFGAAHRGAELRVGDALVERRPIPERLPHPPGRRALDILAVRAETRIGSGRRPVFARRRP